MGWSCILEWLEHTSEDDIKKALSGAGIQAKCKLYANGYIKVVEAFRMKEISMEEIT